MAMSGGTSYLVRSKYADYGNKDWTTDLYVYVKLISQDKINNKSKISLGSDKKIHSTPLTSPPQSMKIKFVPSRTPSRL